MLSSSKYKEYPGEYPIFRFCERVTSHLAENTMSRYDLDANHCRALMVRMPTKGPSQSGNAGITLPSERNQRYVRADSQPVIGSSCNLFGIHRPRIPTPACDQGQVVYLSDSGSLGMNRRQTAMRCLME